MITTCPKCGHCYETTEEDAYDPGRNCYKCWLARNKPAQTMSTDQTPTIDELQATNELCRDMLRQAGIRVPKGPSVPIV